jgi:hypothetical protein
LLIKKEENKKCLDEAAVLEEVDAADSVEDLVMVLAETVFVQTVIIVSLT